jgi:hypothetical protein
MLRKIATHLLSVVLLCAGLPANCIANYRSNLTAASNFIASRQLADGAILKSDTEIDPYFANYAAIGWIKDARASRISDAESWINWYIGHFNWPDSQGLYGTVYNYTYDPSTGVETSSGTYDSADAYAATFLQLIEALWNTDNAGARSFIKSTVGEYDFNIVGNVITDLQQSNGLVYAKPSYKVEYLIDNAEDWAGLEALANLAHRAWDDTNTQSWYQAHASNLKSGIQSVLYIPSTQLYYPSAGSSTPNMSTFYPDAVSQLWPGLQGVVTGSQANVSYSKFNEAWPGWTTLSFGTQSNPVPWCAISYAAFLAGDIAGVNNYISTIQDKYVNVDPAFQWPFYPGEGGWFMRTNAAMDGLK